jgi:hypothetical protein
VDRSFSIIVTAFTAGILGILAGVLGVRLTDRALIDWRETAAVVRDVLASAGLIVGAIWTIYQVWRRRSLIPRASLGHRHEIWKRDGERYLRLIVHINNSGEVRIDPNQAFTIVQTAPIAVDPKKTAEDTWSQIYRIDHPLADDEVEIEPGEVEEYSYDIPIPHGTAYLQVHTCLACPPARRDNRSDPGHAPDPDLENTLHWDATTLIDLEAPPKKSDSEATAVRTSTP